MLIFCIACICNTFSALPNTHTWIAGEINEEEQDEVDEEEED